LKCHQGKTEACLDSKHTTLTDAINITRKVWGIEESNVSLQTIPKPKTKIEKPSDLIDDFLRRKCLKCHLDIQNSGESGMKRKSNCLACHSEHNPKGTCQPKKISSEKCLTCHNKQFVGTDYLGFFPKDHHRSFRAPLTKDGKFPPQTYGIDHHYLNEDIHHMLGMECVDCHNGKGGKKWESSAKCADCHQNPTSKNHPSYHDNISCSACHSAWNISSYELSVFRDDTADYAKWKELTLQEDGYLTNFLNKALKSKKPPKPIMPDWVDKRMEDGIWYSGYRYKRWEHFVLGNNNEGKIEILRPLFQYRISYKDANGTMILDDVKEIDGKSIEAWLPYAPHTITKRAKTCEMCHENPLLLKTKKSDNEIFNLMYPKNIINGAPLTPTQINRLQSPTYKKTRALQLFDKQ
jgi:hypothetical protein